MTRHKTELANYRFERALETSDEAELAYQHDKMNLAENRIYYAMFYMVQALSILSDFSTSKHTTLKGWFNKEFIFTRIIETKYYKIYNRAFDKRQEGDYDDFITFDKEEVKEDIETMKEFLENIGTSLEKEWTPERNQFQIFT